MRNHTTPALSIAPMMDWSDRHFRWVMRQITRHTLLYSEMITTGALLHGDRERFLRFHPDEHPVALQLGGDDPVALATCAKAVEDHGYDEVNLNVGCPSSRVQKGAFGAVLMRRPQVVADAVAAMKAVVKIPVTVKCRIGVDELDRLEDLENFVQTVAPSGADRFTVHARKAWLQGLSPKQNRNVPPLRYPDVHALKVSHADLDIEINGGIRTLEQAADQLAHVDAVMIGRAATDTPWIFSNADRLLFGSDRAPTREEVVQAVVPYMQQHLDEGGRFHHVARHLMHLYKGQPGARRWRQHLAACAQQDGVTADALLTLP